LATTPKKIFKSDATASQVLVRARAATKARYSSNSGCPSVIAANSVPRW